MNEIFLPAKGWLQKKEGKKNTLWHTLVDLHIKEAHNSVIFFSVV